MGLKLSELDGIVFDIGRGRYDHHQKDRALWKKIFGSRIIQQAFGLLRKLGDELRKLRTVFLGRKRREDVVIEAIKGNAT